MYVLGLDFESTGLDTQEARIIEIGAVIWDTDIHTPILMKSMIVNPGVPIPPVIEKLTGLTNDIVTKFGMPLDQAIAELNYMCIKAGPRFAVAHNAFGFDRPLLNAELARHNLKAPNLEPLPWIDTRQDLPFEVEPESRKLKHLALDAGFINYFPHRAVFDVLTTLKVMSEFTMESIEAYQKIPIVTLRIMASYEQRQIAKDLRYSWERAGEKTYTKCWVKLVRENLIPMEVESAKKLGLEVVVI